MLLTFLNLQILGRYLKKILQIDNYGRYILKDNFVFYYIKDLTRHIYIFTVYL